jgi:hypothetical protein
VKPSGDRLYRRESDEAGNTVEQRLCVRFENWSEEFLVLARLRSLTPEPQGNQWPAVHEGQGGFAFSQHLDTRNQPIYAWAG